MPRVPRSLLGLSVAVLLVPAASSVAGPPPPAVPKTVEEGLQGLKPGCDAQGNPLEPAFVTLESMLSPDAQALLSASEAKCAFMRDERDTGASSATTRTVAAARAFCRSQARTDATPTRAACLELCLAQLDWAVFSELHAGIVRALQTLASSPGCLAARAPSARWACAKGPLLPRPFVYEVSDAGVQSVQGQFVDGGATWRLEVGGGSACVGARAVLQRSPPIVCKDTNVRTCNASSL